MYYIHHNSGWPVLRAIHMTVLSTMNKGTGNLAIGTCA